MQRSIHIVAYSSCRGPAKVAKFLVKNGADVNKTALEKCIPLHLAAGNGCIETVKTLLRKGAKANVIIKME
ncbi:MAG: ankyrin repeat domain-containing protein [Wolbachia sp.]